MLKFVKFMSGTVGRSIRVVGGVILIWWGSAMIGAMGIALIVLGMVALIAGLLNICLIAPFIGVSFKGKDILALPNKKY